MPTDEVCRKLRKLLSAMFRKAFDRNLDALLRERNQELWLLGVDEKKKQFVDVCGTIGSDILSAIQARGFHNTDAGYRADAQTVLPLNDRRADIFLLNVRRTSRI